MTDLTDTYNRKFSYLRLSLTEKCNFRCSYCLPNGYQSSCSEADLNTNEVSNLLYAFRELSFTKVRLTGGEPGLRKDLVHIVSTAKDFGFEKIAMTTNGFNLNSTLDKLVQAGLDQINISLDSLNSKKFEDITGSRLGSQIIASIERAIALGISSVKINAVLLKGLNDDDLPLFLNWIKDLPITVRFIELMPTLETKDYFKEYFCSSNTMLNFLLDHGWVKRDRSLTAGPAVEYIHPDYKGSIGFITPLNSGFCDTCNRLRITSKGGLRLCLFGNGQISLRPLLQSRSMANELIKLIGDSVLIKTPAHSLLQGDYGDTKSLSSCGG